MSSAGTKGVPRAERAQQILSIAVDEFAVRGYAGASMVSMAELAGISKPLIYQYFGSKDGLYLTCLEHVAGALLDRLDEAQVAEDDSVASRIHTLRAIFEALEPQRNAWKLLYDSTIPSAGPIASSAAAYRARLTALAASGSQRFLRARGQRSTLDASALTQVWMGLVDSLVSWWIDHPRESAQDMTDRCHRLIVAVLG